MLVVKPNLRRMRYMRDSPSENGISDRRRVDGLRWKRVFLAGAIAGVVLLGLIVLATHY